MANTKRGAKPERSFINASTLEPPADLAPELRELWRQIVAECPAGQLRTGDLPLLRGYVETSALAREANARLLADGQLTPDGKVSPWAALSAMHAKTCAALASKLRIAPSSRIRAEAASLQRTPIGGGAGPFFDEDGRRYLDEDCLIPLG